VSLVVELSEKDKYAPASVLSNLARTFVPPPLICRCLAGLVVPIPTLPLANTVTLGVPDDVTASTTINLPAAGPTATARFLRVSGTGTGAGPHQLEYAAVDTSGSQSTNIVALNNPTTIDSFTVAQNRNVAMVGPLTINNNETITVGNGSTFKIL